ncbi:MAG: type II toxin-antitoxin system RelE/ParE family toxin [Bacteroidales bacterium]|nr:type II toxin-antitoxin system RelE/ParE family toxin [Bacteroidales bacterium]
MGGQKLEIVWTNPAKQDLRNIYDFLDEISPTIAENQIIIDTVFDTRQNPRKMKNQE